LGGEIKKWLDLKKFHGFASSPVSVCFTQVQRLQSPTPVPIFADQVPALQTLLLFAQSLDTDTNCQRIVADEWIEINLTEPEMAQSLVTSTLQLRNAWEELLRMRLALSRKDGEGLLEMICRGCTTFLPFLK